MGWPPWKNQGGVALLKGRASASKGADREENPKGRTYTSAHIGGTPDPGKYP